MIKSKEEPFTSQDLRIIIPNTHLPLETFIDLLSKVNFQT